MASKVSDITVTDIINYIHLDEVSVAEQSELTTYLNIAKNYICNYTGLPLNKYTATSDTTPQDGKTYYTLVSGVYTQFTGTTFATGTVYYEKTADDDVDDFADLIIVVYVLCQDMYDNRSMYIDKGSVNKVVETILGMHTRVNL